MFFAEWNLGSSKLSSDEKMNSFPPTETVELNGNIDDQPNPGSII